MQPEQPRAELVIQFVSGPLSGQTVHSFEPIVDIGRDLANTLVISSDIHVSRLHARITWTDGAWRIENLSRSNVVRVNDQDVTQAELTPGVVVSLGETTSFVVQSVGSIAAVADSDSDSDSEAASVTALPGSDRAAKLDPAVAAGQSSARPERDTGPRSSQSQLPGQDSATQVAELDELDLPTLEISSNIREGKRVYPLTAASISIGRDPSSDIVIDDLIISSHHLQITREGAGYVLTHPHPDKARTLNGLYYQGRKIQGDERFSKRLAPGDVFRIGDEQGVLITLKYRTGDDAQRDVAPPIHPIKLDAAELTIGRAQDNRIVLPHPLVSGRHARLTRVGGAYQVQDLNSTNHVYVNGQQVMSQTLKMGDELRIGPYRLRYETTQLVQYDESQTIRLDAVMLSKTRGDRTLLHDISLSVPPRTFVALVGASGAGKSTLLDALCGLRPADKGEVLYNGQDFYRNQMSLGTRIGYVPQDDIVHRELTVERALYFAAKLRLPSDFTNEQIEQRIAEVLEDVELTAQRTQPVKQLSGGQRKRVSLALELLANPSLFFLDEPTSGLDPGLDRKMMILLRKLADKGHTVVLVTHATNNINVCDFVCFLATGGRLAYFGPPEDARAYFGKTDFAEIYTELEAAPERANAATDAEARFRASPEYHIYIASPLAESNSRDDVAIQERPHWRLNLGTPWRQWVVLTARYLELFKNDPINLSILLLQAPVIALLLMSFTTSNVFVNNFGVDAPARAPLFLMVVTAIWFGVINAVREIVKEAPIYRRERAMRLGIAPYILSKVGVLGVLCLVQSLVLVVVIGWKAGYPAHGIFWPPLPELYIGLALTSLSGLMLGLTLSSLAPNADRAISLVPLIMLPEIIFSGAMFQLSGALGALADIMATRWGFAALGGTLRLRYFAFCAPLPPGVSPLGIPHGDCPIGSTEGLPDQATFGNFYPKDTGHLLGDWRALVTIIMLTFALTIYFQKRKDVERR